MKAFNDDVLLTFASAASQGEYCSWETFSAKCQEGEMIVMENATYGRMRMGRCVVQDFGYLGCGKSVLHKLHRSVSVAQTYIFIHTDTDWLVEQYEFS